MIPDTAMKKVSVPGWRTAVCQPENQGTKKGVGKKGGGDGMSNSGLQKLRMSDAGLD